MTYFRNRNYGSVLQAYALRKHLENCGHDAYIINYFPESHGTKEEFLGAPKGPLLKKVAYIVGSFPIRMKLYRIYKDFRETHLGLTQRHYRNSMDLAAHLPRADVYVTGSDQVWKSNLNFQSVDNGYTYYLDFTPEDKRRVSYASSFGDESLNLEYDSHLSRLLKRYHRVSVREASGLAKLRSLGRTDGLRVLDPTLLLRQEDWAPLFGSARVRAKYLLIYDPQRTDLDKFRDCATAIARERGLQIVSISKEYWRKPWVHRALYPSVYDFLALLANAEFVLTNSFHGVAFCLNFQRQFACFPANYSNNRVIEMLQLAGLEGRMIAGEQELGRVLSSDINFTRVGAIIEANRRASMRFLEEAVSPCD